MKAVMLSIRPKWVEKIANGEKTVEVRKSVPKCGAPFKVYMYETRDGGHSCKRCKETSETCYSWAKRGVGCYNGRGKVVGEFECDKIEEITATGKGAMFKRFALFADTCLTVKELNDYLGIGNTGYGLHISDLKIYDKPKELREFRKQDKSLDYASFGDIDRTYNITRPPQSWYYVVETGRRKR